ncbi:MAG: ABC transporter ATP-binding protein [Sarcina sp.]
MSSAISVENLTKTYNGNRGINNITFEVKSGEIVGFIGPNGAGKSTTIKILLNMLFKDKGLAKVLNLDCEEDSKLIKEKIGYVPSEVNFYESVKVGDIINYSKSFYSNVDQQRVDKICEILEVDKNKRMKELSLGNKKKVAIVQALVEKPKLIILDEPTNGLDPLIQKKLFDILLEEKKLGTTIFLSSHNLTEIQNYCDKVIIIREGEIVDIKDIKSLSMEKRKKVTIITNEINIDELKDFSNKIEIIDGGFRFIFNGDVNKLIVFLSSYKLKDFCICEEELLDTFMDYYEEKSNL